MSLSAIPKATRQRIFDRDRARRRYCGLVQIGQSAVFHINHIIPKTQGGVTDDANLAVQCPYCSLHKSNKTMAQDPVSGEMFALFHPIEQQWNEHFTLDDTGVCQGKSGIGRPTVFALHMNDPLPRVARAIQIRLGLLTVTE